MENWKNVLEKFLKEYKEKDYVIGAILCGSYATGNNTDRSDIDVHIITKDMVKEGAVVVDVGINRVNGKILGDVDTESVLPICSKITPVPGGVGLTTVLSLLENVVQATIEQNKEGN